MSVSKKEIERLIFSIEYEVEDRDYWLGVADAFAYLLNACGSEDE
jgi:hypothetical protein